MVSVSVKAPGLPVHETTTSGRKRRRPRPQSQTMLVSGGEGKTETVSKATSPELLPGPIPETNSVVSSISVPSLSPNLGCRWWNCSAYPNDAETDRSRSALRNQRLSVAIRAAPSAATTEGFMSEFPVAS